MEQNVDQVILNRLASEIGTLKARVIQVETYNEILVSRLKEYEEREQDIAEVESGDGIEEEVGE